MIIVGLSFYVLSSLVHLQFHALPTLIGFYPHGFKFGMSLQYRSDPPQLLSG